MCLTYVSLVLLADVDVLAGGLYLQEVPEDLLVDLQVGDTHGEVVQVVFVQQLEDLSHGTGDNALLFVPERSCEGRGHRGQQIG